MARNANPANPSAPSDRSHAFRVRELRRQLQISQEEQQHGQVCIGTDVGSVERGERDIGITAIGQLAGASGCRRRSFSPDFDDGCGARESAPSPL